MKSLKHILAISLSFGLAMLLTNSVRLYDERRQNSGRATIPVLDEMIRHAKVSNENDPVINDSLKGKLIIINLWATWCGPCLNEIGDLNELVKANTNNPNVKFFALSDYYQNISEDKLAYLKKPFLYQRLYNRQFVYRYLQSLDFSSPESLPKHIVIGTNGNLLLYLSGAGEKNLQEIKRVINENS